MERRILIAIIALLLTTSIVFATVYTHRYAHFNTYISQPHVWFEDPYTPNVTVYLYNYKTNAIVDITAGNLGLHLENRTGTLINLTQGQNYVLQYFNETGQGCNFYYTEEGGTISVTGNPRGGLYGGCSLIYKYPFQTPVNSSFIILMKTNDVVSPTDGIRGLSLHNTSNNYYYLAGIKNNESGWYFGIYKYNVTNPQQLPQEKGSRVLPGLKEVIITSSSSGIGSITGIWFGISFSYTLYPNGTVLLRAWLYNITGGGRLVAYVEALDYWPIYVNDFGLTVYQIRQQPSAVFQIDGFTTETIVVFKGLSYCCNVYVYDSNGAIVGWGHVNESNIVEIRLGNNALYNATIVVSCNDTTFNFTIDVLLGGDVFTVHYWFEGPILMVYTDLLNTSFTGWIRVNSVECNGLIHGVNISLVNSTTRSSNASIIQLGSSLLIYPSETSILLLTPNSTGWTANISLRAEVYPNTYCTLYTTFYYNYTSASIGGLNAVINIKTS